MVVFSETCSTAVVKENLSAFHIPFHTSGAPPHPSLLFLFCHLPTGTELSFSHTHTHSPATCQHCQLMWKVTCPKTAHLQQPSRLVLNVTSEVAKLPLRHFALFGGGGGGGGRNVASFCLRGNTCNELLAASGCAVLSPTGKVEPLKLLGFGILN